ncbi:MAG: Phosphatidate cytidylyltransferase, partial [Planctomycetaceae bacterium]|nr:Phosphatidate cytidylyltransferase [Planctomycetaceae bacterium]
MIFGLHPVAVGILAAAGAMLVLTPLLLVVLDRTGQLNPKLHADLWARYKSWLVMTPLILVPLAAGRLAAIVAVAILSTLCYREFARATGLFRDRLVSALVALGGLLITFSIADNFYPFFHALTSLVVSSIVVLSLFVDQPRGYIQRVALGIFAFMLFAVSLGHYSYLANDRLGVPLQMAIVLCVELNDVFAYCCGKAFGRRKLAPQTSPNKTIGGALGAAILTTLLFATLLHLILRGSPIDHPVHLAILGALLSLTGQCGDLVMSSIKRDLGIKDMAATIPGHGGFLDRFDSMLFVGPVLFH